ncbi:MAG: hypothetical protein SYC29_09170 [Planctomycetota bacterium]|nr:hypothetical protein [Planctomycetota bacterium]
MQRQPTSPRARIMRSAVIAPRRGVASVLAMMFLVIFGSLAVAMAVVAQGNLRTADSSLKVSRAMSAAETGLVFATRRLADESDRFVVEKGVIDADFAEDLWMGTYDEGADGEVEVLPPNGYETDTPPAGIVHAVRDGHLADEHDIIVDAGDSALPEIDAEYGTLRVRPIALTADADGPDPDGPYFRLRYELVAAEPMIRVTSIGVDGDVQRVLQMDFCLEKKIEYAILSPNRIMIGKNVMVEGPLGSRYGVVAGELDGDNGDPLVMRSDFYYLHDTLDQRLDTFYAQVVAYDTDGDARLRPEHPTESQGLQGHADLVDYDGDEYVDDADLFLAFFDDNSDGMVVYDAVLASETGHGSMTEEFADVDDQLARLMDLARPDRDGDGEVTNSDRLLGYKDGILDGLDLYAKLTGRLRFAVARNAWEAAHGESYQTVVEGPIRPGLDHAPVDFEVSDEELREITTEMFGDTHTWFEGQVPNDPPENPVDFLAQVQDGIDSGGTYTPPGEDTWEPVPYGSLGAYDYYQRPVYENMTFENVRIPMGNNGLYINCTFVGVTFIESEMDCAHENWNYAGARERIEDPDTGDVSYVLRFPDMTAMLGETEVADTRVYSNNIRFHNCTFLGSIAGNKLGEYTHWRNKTQMTGFSRFYLDPDDDDLAEQPDSEELINLLNTIDEADRAELAKSSLLMPGWSMDVGNFTNEQEEDPENTPKVKLRGTIVAGILDVRGTADVHGTLLMTFRPIEGAGPLYYGGLTDAFNTTIGYFGPTDGDAEGVDPGDAAFEGFGEIRLRYDPEALLPDGIPWPVRMQPAPETYIEGGTS